MELPIRRKSRMAIGQIWETSRANTHNFPDQYVIAATEPPMFPLEGRDCGMSRIDQDAWLEVIPKERNWLLRLHRPGRGYKGYLREVCPDYSVTPVLGIQSSSMQLSAGIAYRSSSFNQCSLFLSVLPSLIVWSRYLEPNICVWLNTLATSILAARSGVCMSISLKAPKNAHHLRILLHTIHLSTLPVHTSYIRLDDAHMQWGACHPRIA